MHTGYIWKNRIKKFLDNPKAIFPFIRKRVYYNFIADNQLKYYKDFKYLNYDETLDDIIINNKSLVRFGDEVFDLLLGIGLYFGNWHQKYNPRLAEKLKIILASNDPRLLVAFNPEYILKTKAQFAEEGISDQFHFWTHSKIFLKNYIQKDSIYGSALCFNPRFNKNIDYKKLKTYFSSKHILVIASNIDRFKDMSLGIRTEFVECPASDAWEEYDVVKQKLLTKIHDQNMDRSILLILISMSSAGKVLVYEVTKMGYTAWDTGQFFDLASQEIRKM